MGTGPSGPDTPARPVFSPDGFWWWDGREWRPAVSPDRLWRWNGQAWEPNRPAATAGGRGTGAAVAITLVAGIGIVVLVVAVVAVILYAMGNQIANVFSNVAAALGSPSP